MKTRNVIRFYAEKHNANLNRDQSKTVCNCHENSSQTYSVHNFVIIGVAGYSDSLPLMLFWGRRERW